MDRKIDVEMTSRLILWSIFYQMRFFLIIPSVMILVLIWSLVTQARLGVPFGWDFLITPLIFIGLFFWAPVSAYRRTMSQIKKMKTPVMHYHFTDESLNIDTDLSSGRNKWEVFKGLRKHGKIWSIVTQSGLSFTLPVEQLDGELRDFLASKLISLTKSFWKRTATSIFIWLLLSVIVFYFMLHRHP